MNVKKLLISVRYRKGEITAITRMCIRDSALSVDSHETSLPGNFSLSHAPDAASMMDITPELVQMFKDFTRKLEMAVKEAKEADEKALVEAKAAEKANLKAEEDKDKKADNLLSKPEIKSPEK